MARRAVCNEIVDMFAFHSVLSSLAVMAHLLILFFSIIYIMLKKVVTALATLGASSTRICLVFFLPSRRCWCPLSLLRRKVMCAASTIRSSLLAHAPHSPRQKKTWEAMDDMHAHWSVVLFVLLWCPGGLA